MDPGPLFPKLWARTQLLVVNTFLGPIHFFSFLLFKVPSGDWPVDYSSFNIVMS